MLQPMLEQIGAITNQIDEIEKRLKAIAKKRPEVKHLQSVPGVGPLVSLGFVLTIDDPERFKQSRDVGAFFGLRPSMRGSGEIKHYGRITKEGDPQMRMLLVQAAHSLMRNQQPSALKGWAMNIEKRKGKAMVALARRLAVLMHHLWVTGETYQLSQRMWQPNSSGD